MQQSGERNNTMGGGENLEKQVEESSNRKREIREVKIIRIKFKRKEIWRAAREKI